MNKQTVDTQGRELTISRVFDAPRELVFETYTSCDQLKHWWGPRTWPMVECSMDFREGGSWHFCLRGPNDGDESWAIAHFREIIKPEKIVYTDNFSDKDGNINKEMPTFLNTLTFNSRDDKTEIITHSLLDSKEELHKLMDMGMIEGFTETWDRLEEHLAQIQ